MGMKRIGGIGLFKFQQEQKEKKIIKESPEKLEALELENAELLFKSAMADMKAENLENDVADLMFMVANMEMGGTV